MPQISPMRLRALIDIAAEDTFSNVAKLANAEVINSNVTRREIGGIAASRANTRRFKSARATAEKSSRGTMVTSTPI